MKRDASLDVIEGTVTFRTTHFSWVSEAVGTLMRAGTELWQAGGKAFENAKRVVSNAVEKFGAGVNGLSAAAQQAILAIDTKTVVKLPAGFGIKIPSVNEALERFENCFGSVNNAGHCVERLAENGVDALARIEEIIRSCVGIDTLNKYIDPSAISSSNLEKLPRMLSLLITKSP